MITYQNCLFYISVIDVSQDVRPLPDKELSRLNRNRSQLQKLIDCNVLVGHLWSQNCISQFQRESIQSETTSFKSNQLLLEIFIRKSFADFKKLICCLKNIRQPHVARLLEQDGGNCLLSTRT